MKRAERRAIRDRVARTRCPDCNALHLEIIDIHGPAVLCHCGWNTNQLEVGK